MCGQKQRISSHTGQVFWKDEWPLLIPEERVESQDVVPGYFQMLNLILSHWHFGRSVFIIVIIVFIIFLGRGPFQVSKVSLEAKT